MASLLLHKIHPMRYIITLSLLMLTFVMSAQRNKEFQIRAGIGGAGYATFSDFGYNIGALTVRDQDTSGAAATHFNLDLRYELTRRLAIGLDFKVGSYIYDPEENNEGKSNGYVVSGINADFSIVNRDRFRWYVGLGFNVTNLEIRERKTAGPLVLDNTFTYRGGGFKFNTGIIKYFGDSPFGVHFNIGSDNHRLVLDEVIQNGNSINISNIDGELKLRGLDFCFGLVVRLRP